MIVAFTAESGETTTFAVADIPIAESEVNKYTINWDAFAQDGSGVTRQIDSDGDGTFEQTIEIQVPTASFTYSPESPTSGQTITFDATSSYDPDGEITSYKWDFGDGRTFEGETSTVTHTYSSGGDYTVILAVRDNHGAVNTSTTTITVTPIYEVYLPFTLKNYP
jgi:PKD repeat protein